MVRFLAIADFGCPTDEMRQVAKAMSSYALRHQVPTSLNLHILQYEFIWSMQVDCILGLGDNFYPSGVLSVNDPLFNSCWRNVFLRYPSLQVPWYLTLGNHDYEGRIQAQIDYTFDKVVNPDGLWHMPDRCYEVSFPTLEIFVLDSNAAQWSVRTRYPYTMVQMRDDIARLKEKLQASKANWKVVVSHHPIYTQSRGHFACAELMRSNNRINMFGDVSSCVGFGLEGMLVEQGVDLHIAGHEHVFQYHQRHGLHHVGCGASGADIRHGTGLYRGRNEQISLDWVGRAEDIGFVAIETSRDRLNVQFINCDEEVIKSVSIPCRTAAEKTSDFEEYQTSLER